MNEIIFEENTPVSICLAKTLIRNTGNISADTITFQMDSGEKESRIFLENVCMCDAEMLATQASDKLDIILEYKDTCYSIQNLYLFMEKIKIHNGKIMCSLYFDNKLSTQQETLSIRPDPVVKMDLLDYPALRVEGAKGDIEFVSSTHEQFSGRSSIHGVRPLYTKNEEGQKEEIHTPHSNLLQTLDVFSSREKVATLKVGQGYWTLRLIPASQGIGA